MAKKDPTKIVQCNPCSWFKELRESPTEEQKALEEQRKFKTIIEVLGGKRAELPQTKNLSEFEQFLLYNKHLGMNQSSQYKDKLEQLIKTYKTNPINWNTNTCFAEQEEKYSAIIINMEPFFESGKRIRVVGEIYDKEQMQTYAANMQRKFEEEDCYVLNIVFMKDDSKLGHFIAGYNAFGDFSNLNISGDDYHLNKENGVFEYIGNPFNFQMMASSKERPEIPFYYRFNDKNCIEILLKDFTCKAMLPRQLNLINLFDFALERIERAHLKPR